MEVFVTRCDNSERVFVCVEEEDTVADLVERSLSLLLSEGESVKLGAELCFEGDTAPIADKETPVQETALEDGSNLVLRWIEHPELQQNWSKNLKSGVKELFLSDCGRYLYVYFQRESGRGRLHQVNHFIMEMTHTGDVCAEYSLQATTVTRTDTKALFYVCKDHLHYVPASRKACTHPYCERFDLSFCGNFVYSLSSRNTIEQVCTTTCAVLRRIEVPQPFVLSLGSSPSGMLYCCGSDNILLGYNLGDTSPSVELNVGFGSVALSASPCGKYVALVCGNGQVSIYRTDSYEISRKVELQLTSAVTGMMWPTHSSWLFVKSSEFLPLCAETGRLSGSVCSVQLTPCGNFYVVVRISLYSPYSGIVYRSDNFHPIHRDSDINRFWSSHVYDDSGSGRWCRTVHTVVCRNLLYSISEGRFESKSSDLNHYRCYFPCLSPCGRYMYTTVDGKELRGCVLRKQPTVE